MKNKKDSSVTDEIKDVNNIQRQQSPSFIYDNECRDINLNSFSQKLNQNQFFNFGKMDYDNNNAASHPNNQTTINKHFKGYRLAYNCMLLANVKSFYR